MKPYQHHDEYHDIGKAEPKPKGPNPKGPLPLTVKPVSDVEYRVAHGGMLLRNTPRIVDLKRRLRSQKKTAELLALAS